jgi:hypothetical protein
MAEKTFTDLEPTVLKQEKRKTDDDGKNKLSLQKRIEIIDGIESGKFKSNSQAGNWVWMRMHMYTMMRIWMKA